MPSAAAQAAIDRVVHRSIVLEFECEESLRMQEARARQDQPIL